MDQAYCEVQASAHRWIAKKQQEFPAGITVQHLIDGEDALRVLIKTPLRIAELLVSGDNDFTPYRWTSFQVLELHGEEKEPPSFCYFDSPQASPNEILQQLNLGMAILLEGVDS